MFRKLGIVVLLLAVMSPVLAWAKGYEAKKAAGKYEVTLKVGSYPLVKGNNSVTVIVTDKAGKAVTNAAVSVRYFMPPMPGMAPMEYTAKPVLKGSEYNMSADIPMEGGWKIEVTVGDSSATFNVDAR
ncbi:MAG: FixH family protein [Nitrospiraceae bacterium]|nr:FixH family protein [Nitrospiraceae bacterium]